MRHPNRREVLLAIAAAPLIDHALEAQVSDSSICFLSTIEMARLIQQDKPDEARKLLEPLRTSVRTAISQAALTALGEIMQQK